MQLVGKAFVSYLILIFIMTQPVFAKTFGQLICKTEQYTCHRVRGNESWRSLFSDVHQRDIVMRVNRMNTGLYPGLTIAIPKNLATASLMDFSPFPLQIEAPNERLIIVDPMRLAWGAYDTDGTLVRWGPISGGANYCRDIDEECQTHAGTFRIYSLGSSDCISHKFPLPDGGAPMPYCMYFNNGEALHGEPDGLPGYNASHGCVRLYVNDAEWLRYDFVENANENNDYRGTKIIVGSY